MAAGVWCFCFPTQKNLPQSPVHPFGPKEGHSFHKCYRCKNAKAGALNVSWESCPVVSEYIIQMPMDSVSHLNQSENVNLF